LPSAAPPPPPPPPPPWPKTCPDGSVVAVEQPCPVPLATASPPALAPLPPTIVDLLPPPPRKVRQEEASNEAEHVFRRDGVHAFRTAGLSEKINAVTTSIPAPHSPDERIYCDVIGKFITASMCNEARTIAANARQGLGEPHFPESMTRGETRNVWFTVRRPAPGEVLPPSAGRTSGASQPFTLKITGRMAATLVGEGFKIDPATMQYRDVGISDAARWDWNITALRAPRHHLTLTAYMVVEAPDGSNSPSAIVPSKEVDIPVDVTIQQRVSDASASIVEFSNSAKAVIAALVALLVALAALKGRIAELFGRSAKPAAKQD